MGFNVHDIKNQDWCCWFTILTIICFLLALCLEGWTNYCTIGGGATDTTSCGTLTSGTGIHDAGLAGTSLMTVAAICAALVLFFGYMHWCKPHSGGMNLLGEGFGRYGGKF